MEEIREEKVVFFKEFKKEALKKRLKDGWEFAKEKVGEGINWVMEHPVESAGMAAAASTAISKTVRHRTVKTEERRRETEFYDPRTGMYAKSRRPLTAREKLAAERRYKEGFSWNQVLDEMRLLK